MPENIKILNDLKRHLTRNLDKSVTEVVLFGSQARGDSHEHSDYDVLIVVDGDYTGSDENRVLDLCYDIDLKYNILLDVHIISVKELGSIRGDRYKSATKQLINLRNLSFYGLFRHRYPVSPGSLKNHKVLISNKLGEDFFFF
jgi:uncharacterized protein